MQLSLFTDTIDPTLAPTNLTSSRHPIHRWKNFIAGYSPEFVSVCIREACLTSGDTVLDPFGGLGTTPVQSLLDGFSCIAYEANPYFADLATAKCQAALGNVEPDEVFSTLHKLAPYGGELANIYSVDALKFLQKLIPEAQLRFLVSAKLREQEITTKNQNTTTIPTEIKKNHELYAKQLSSEFVQYLIPLVEQLKIQKNQKAGKKDYYALVFPYFASIQKVFADCFKVLKPNSPIHVVVGDAYLYGVHIPTGKLTLYLLQEIGFDTTEMKLLRTRGSRWMLSKREGAGTPIGEYWIYGRRP